MQVFFSCQFQVIVVFQVNKIQADEFFGVKNIVDYEENLLSLLNGKIELFLGIDSASYFENGNIFESRYPCQQSMRIGKAAVYCCNTK